jgi:histidinol-phosphate aminotransferase
MAAAVGPRTRLVMVCSPNNPTGTVVTRAELERFLAAVGPDVVVALDEAYHEYVTDPDAADGLSILDAHPNLVVLRTFSKAYRLAALRVGYAVAAPEIATALRKVCAPFSVSAIAQAGAIAALDHAEDLLATCAEVVTERVRVRDALLAAGHVVPETQANFVWLALGDRARSSRRTAWRSTRWWCGPSRATACASPSPHPRRTTRSSQRRCPSRADCG